MNKNRLLYAVLGTITMLFSGLVYSWSVLSRPIAATFKNWDSATLSFTFTLCMSFFCLGGLFAGILSKKLGIRINFIIAAVLFVTGFFISSKTNTPILLYVGFGVMAGTASGMSYNTIMSTLTGHYPEKTGLISGTLLMGFGLGSFIVGKLYQRIVSLGYDWRNIFITFGIILFALLIMTSFIIKPADNSEKNKSEDYNLDEQITPINMVKSLSFKLFFIWAILLSSCGLAIISQASGILLEVDPNTSETSISTIVGLISIFSGLGRFAFGSLFDKIGRKKTMLLNEILYLIAIVSLLISFNTSRIWITIIAFIFTGLAYGGVPTSSSAVTSAFYGRKYYAINFSLMNMNLLLASFGGTVAGKLYDLSKSYMITVYCMIGLIVLGFIIEKGIKKGR